MEFNTILYQKMGKVAKITMNRPEVRNAQTRNMLCELDRAFAEAAEDEEVRVIVLAGAGPDFSAGHDLGSREGLEERKVEARWTNQLPGGVPPRVKFEEEIYLNTALRWRDIPKPTIAQVQGNAIIAGFMLALACDLIVAAENAKFLEHAIRWAAPSGEFCHHPWDLGARKAKELLFTGDAINAHEAYRLGLVNMVVPVERLEEETLKLANKIAANDPFILQLAKRTINECQDIMGYRQALRAAFYMHQLAHAHMLIKGEQIGPRAAQGESPGDWAKRLAKEREEGT